METPREDSGADKDRPELDYDKVLDHIGQFGPFQRRIFLWLSFISAAAGLAVVAFAFIGFEPNYRCRVAHCDNSTPSYFSEDTGRLPSWLANSSIPLSQRCVVPTSSERSCDDSSVVYYDGASGPQCGVYDLIFDQTISRFSLVQEFGFVCERATLRSFYNAIYMLGMLLGSYVFGWISDKHGRMKALLIAVMTVSLSGFFGAFCGGRWGQLGYGLMRVLTGMGGIGCFMVSFVLVVEHVGARFTSLIGVAIEIPFALGQGVLGLEAYFVRDWRVLQILAHLPLLGLAGLYFIVPESVRWLLANGKGAEAKEIIQEAARTNKVSIPDFIMDRVDMEATKQEKKVAVTKSASLTDVFRHRVICLRTLNMCYQVTPMIRA